MFSKSSASSSRRTKSRGGRRRLLRDNGPAAVRRHVQVTPALAGLQLQRRGGRQLRPSTYQVASRRPVEDRVIGAGHETAAGDVVPNGNLIRAGQAACSHSCRMPPRRSRRWMSRRTSRSGSVIGSGNSWSGLALAMPWCAVSVVERLVSPGAVRCRRADRAPRPGRRSSRPALPGSVMTRPRHQEASTVVRRRAGRPRAAPRWTHQHVDLRLHLTHRVRHRERGAVGKVDLCCSVLRPDHQRKEVRTLPGPLINQGSAAPGRVVAAHAPLVHAVGQPLVRLGRDVFELCRSEDTRVQTGPALSPAPPCSGYFWA